jgi:hypothetical protein
MRVENVILGSPNMTLAKHIHRAIRSFFDWDQLEFRRDRLSGAPSGAGTRV